MNAANPKPQPRDADSALNAPDDAIAAGVVAAIKTLLTSLPPERQKRALDQIFKAFPPENPRAGQVLGTILKLVPRDRPFTIEEVKKSVESEGISATAKAIYNALGYLRKKERIVRVGHGRYMVDGALIETTEDLGIGPPTRHEIDDT